MQKFFALFCYFCKTIRKRICLTINIICIMKKYVCDVCGWVYDPAVGVPEAGIAPGTPFEKLPDDFECPLCAMGKEHFSVIE